MWIVGLITPPATSHSLISSHSPLLILGLHVHNFHPTALNLSVFSNRVDSSVLSLEKLNTFLEVKIYYFYNISRRQVLFVERLLPYRHLRTTGHICVVIMKPVFNLEPVLRKNRVVFRISAILFISSQRIVSWCLVQSYKVLLWNNLSRLGFELFAPTFPTSWED